MSVCVSLGVWVCVLHACGHVCMSEKQTIAFINTAGKTEHENTCTKMTSSISQNLLPSSEP